jgi:hypothetical protein
MMAFPVIIPSMLLHLATHQYCHWKLLMTWVLPLFIDCHRILAPLSVLTRPKWTNAAVVGWRTSNIVKLVMMGENTKTIMHL